MSMDANLIGVWKPKGATAPHRKYRIEANGQYFSAYPAAPFAFADAGYTLLWGGVTYSKTLGTPGVIEGVWLNVADGDEWHFRADGSCTVHVPTSEDYFGSYEIQGGGTTPWFDQFVSVITTAGANITFDPPYQSDFTYLYTLSEPHWVLTDPATSNTVFEYERV